MCRLFTLQKSKFDEKIPNLTRVMGKIRINKKIIFEDMNANISKTAH